MLIKSLVKVHEFVHVHVHVHVSACVVDWSLTFSMPQ